ncbi:MAG: oligosaccharide flippase family protein, partial [Bacteroidales bacterium]
MLSRLKSTAKNSIIYGVGNLSSKLIGLVLLPLYTSVLPVAEFGKLAMLETTAQILVAIFGLSLNSAYFRWYWDKEYSGKQKSLFFTIFAFLGLMVLLMILGLTGAASKLSLFLLDTDQNAKLIRLMVITTAFDVLGVLPLTLMRLQERPVLFISSNLIKFTANLLLTILFIVGLHHRIEGIYEAQIIGNIILFVFLSKYIWKHMEFRFESKILKEMLAFSLPLMLASIAGFFITMTDRYTLKFMNGLAQLGSYQFGFKVSNSIKIIVVNSLNYAVQPLIYRLMNEPNNKRFYSKVLTYSGFAIMYLVILISVFGKELVMLLAQKKEYWNAYLVIPFLSFGLFFGSLRDTLFTGLSFAKKSKVSAAITISSAVINVLLNIVLIFYFQSIGAAVATLLAQFIYFSLVWKYSQKYYFIPYETFKIFKIFLTGAFLTMIAMFANSLPLLPSLGIKIVIIALFPVLLYLWDFYEEIELVRMKELWMKW